MEFFKKIFGREAVSQEGADDYYEKGKAQVLAAHYRDAISDLDLALKQSPGHVNALFERGKAKTGIKDFKGAIADFNKLIAIQPKNASAYQRRAKAKDFLKDYKGALEDLNTAIRLQPDFSIAYYERALIKIMAMKDKKSAYGDLTTAGVLGLTIAYDALREFYNE